MAIPYIDKAGLDELVAKVKQLVASSGVGAAFTQASDGTATLNASDDPCLRFRGEDGASVQVDASTDELVVGIDGISAGKVTSGVLPVARGGTGGATAQQNEVFAAPYGQDGAPAFRALHSSDIPSLSPTKSGFQAGRIAVSSVSANSGADSAVTFTPAFSSAPMVIVGMMSNQTAYTGQCSAYAMNVTSNGFTLRRQNNYSGARNIGAYWMAFEI